MTTARMTGHPATLQASHRAEKISSSARQVTAPKRAASKRTVAPGTSGTESQSARLPRGVEMSLEKVEFGRRHDTVTTKMARIEPTLDG